MSYEVLARKWRPQVFQDVIGQDHITQTLMNAIKSDRLAHAYLFSGARGVGKTSVARILAKAINCPEGEPGIPCNRCHVCAEITHGSSVDVQEIDGASNRGVDEIRELRENIKFMPSGGRFRIYIIDEVHMLTKEAFNALLKTLEEPPPHAKFFFATTEPHKVPVTILSRCQRFDFKRIALSKIVNHLERITKAEGIDLSRAGLTLIAREAEGSMRDAESLLDQVVAFAGNKVETEHITDILGIVDRDLLSESSLAILEGSAQRCVEIVNRVYNQGYDIKEYYKALMDQFRNLLIGLVAPQGDLLDISDDEINEIKRQGEMAGIQKVQQCLNLLIAREEDLKYTSHPRLVLETIMIKLCRLGEVLSFDDLIRKIGELEQRLSGSFPSKPDSEDEASTSRLADHRLEWKREGKEAKALQPTAENSQLRWEELLKFLLTKNGPMANILKEWRLHGLNSDVLEISRGASAFSSSYLDEPERLGRLADYCREFFGREIKIKIVANNVEGNPGEGQPKESTPIEAEQNPVEAAPPVRNVLEIFEGQIRAKVPAKTDGHGTEARKTRR